MCVDSANARINACLWALSSEGGPVQCVPLTQGPFCDVRQVPVSGRATVVGAAVEGKHLLLHLSDGRATILKAKRGAANLESGDDKDVESGDASDVRLVVVGRIGRKRNDPIVACAIYVDRSGVFTVDDDDDATATATTPHAAAEDAAAEDDDTTTPLAADGDGGGGAAAANGGNGPDHEEDEDDIDELLYGDDDADGGTAADAGDAPDATRGETDAPEEEEESALDAEADGAGAPRDGKRPWAPVWCVVARRSGSLAMHALPDLAECFVFKSFMMTPRLVRGRALLPSRGSVSCHGLLPSQGAATCLCSSLGCFPPRVLQLAFYCTSLRVAVALDVGMQLLMVFLIQHGMHCPRTACDARWWTSAMKKGQCPWAWVWLVVALPGACRGAWQEVWAWQAPVALRQVRVLARCVRGMCGIYGV